MKEPSVETTLTGRLLWKSFDSTWQIAAARIHLSLRDAQGRTFAVRYCYPAGSLENAEVIYHGLHHGNVLSVRIRGTFSEDTPSYEGIGMISVLNVDE